MRRALLTAFLGFVVLGGCDSSTDELTEVPEPATEPVTPEAPAEPESPVAETPTAADPACEGCEIREQFGSRVCRKRDGDPEGGVTTWLNCEPSCCPGLN